MIRNANVPYVIEKTKNGERCYDVYSRLLEDRTIFIGEEIGSNLANSVVAQLLLLNQQDKDRDIFMYINSPGGCVMSGLAIYDTMRYINCDVRTVCVGLAASMAAVLLSAGTKGKRFALPNSRIMIHQPRSTGAGEMTVTEQEIDFKLSRSLKRQLTQILADNTGNPYKVVAKDCEKDKWLTASEALKYGLLDEVITKQPVE